MSLTQSFLARCSLMVCLCTVITVFLLAGCGSSQSRSPYKNADEGYQRNIQLGENYYQQAMKILANESVDDDERIARDEKAEAILLQALSADLYNGPAHNNLGVIYMNQDRLYDAANEFTWARKLLPGHPDPRVNLAAVLDAGGQSTDALAAAQSALEIQPQYVPAMQTIALIQVRDRNTNKETLAMLDTIAYRGESKQWRDWATNWIAKLDK
ncbi:MAG: hypothetical protein HRU15_05625 [Planctomycetes bacterium]|nr:hypothetical protein [Planctomycetota bacterium]